MSYKLPTITPEEILSFSNYIYEFSGIKIGFGKGYLLENRFSSIMEELQCASFEELYNLSKRNSDKILEEKLIDAITTHETYFFRDDALFEFLKQILIPDLLDSQKRKRLIDSVPIPLSIWSAACSTGQEVYSLAIILKELENLHQYRLKLLGTDISEMVINKAICGNYNDFEIKRGLSEERRMRFFHKKENSWAVNDEIRTMASFRKVNLIRSFHELGKFDIIFCRNVALYFSQADRSKFFRSIAETMHSESYLFVGSTESLSDLSDIFVGSQQMNTLYYKLR